MKLIHREEELAGVSERTKQAREVRARWAWVEPCVWTERMLTALEKGVKGGVWFSLIDKVYSKRNLLSAFKRVKANRGSAGVDHITVEKFSKRLEDNIERVHKRLKEGSYYPQKIRRVYIPKPGRKERRPLGIPTVRDRVVQAALRQVIEPIFELDFSDNSYGFRPGCSCKDALREVDQLLKGGSEYVVDADIEDYFDSIPHDRIMEQIGERIADGRALRLVESFLKQGVLEGMREWRPEKGTPQGGVISPLLANLYLDPLDHLMEAKGFMMIRYADDFVVLCSSEKEAHRAMEQIKGWIRSVGLRLHSDKTRVVDMRKAGFGFDFLGYHFERTRHSRRISRWPREKSMQGLKDKIRGRTRRCNGNSLEQIIESINPTLRGWFEYFKHSHKWTFPWLDRWVRMRLRSILRKRAGGRGRGRGLDNNRWPNTFFTALGLFSLTAAHEAVCQSLKRLNC